MGRKVSIPDDLATDINRIFDIWSDCQRQYHSAGDWLFGKFSVADAMFAPVVLRFRTYGINLPESVLNSKAMQNWLAAAESEVEVIETDEKGQ